MKNKISTYVIQFLLYLVVLLTDKKQPIKSVNRQDMELLQTAFPPFSYKAEMTMEQIALGTAKSVGEQRVLQYLLSRIQGRIGQGVAYD